MEAQVIAPDINKPVSESPKSPSNDDLPEAIPFRRTRPAKSAVEPKTVDFTPFPVRPAAPASPVKNSKTRYSSEQQACIIEETFVPVHLAMAAKFNSAVDAPGFRRYLGRLLENLVDPNDPIEAMICEQVAFAHLRLAKLHGGAGQAESAECIRRTNAASIHLMSEFRKMVLALESYRAMAADRRKKGDHARKTLAARQEHPDGTDKRKT